MPFCSRSPCQRLWTGSRPFTTTTSGTFVPLIQCVVYMFYGWFRTDSTPQYITSIAGRCPDVVSSWVGQICFWTATIAFPLYKRTHITWGSTAPTESARFSMPCVSTPRSMRIFHLISLTHSCPSFLVSSFVSTCSWVAYRSNICPYNRLQSG